MHFIDFVIFAIYFIVVLGIGVYFFRKNKTRSEYYVGDRSISASHIGFSIVATDVGGGFSIGLGGLGFLMGLSGSWLLFTGLLGAWLAAVLVIPKIKSIDKQENLLTFPDFLKLHYNNKVVLAAALISGIGYLGFTSAQILAGAKLAAGTVFAGVNTINPLDLSLYIMTAIIIVYTVMGGLKAVIYTDTFQWMILLSGLILFGIPFAYIKVGGYAMLRSALPAEFFSLTNLHVSQFINWLFTIVPIWFIAMTLYQRIYACRNVKEAQKAFFLAGILEYPLMAFAGVILGMIARIYFPDVDSEIAMPMLLREILPIGIKGIVIAAYFSAIMSTADSCLIASSGNFVNDVIEAFLNRRLSHKSMMRLSQAVTLVIGVITFIIANSYTTVLSIILHAYSFMVAGLFIPTVMAYFSKYKSSRAALVSMFGGGGFTLILIFTSFGMPWNLDASVWGLLLSAFLYAIVMFIELRNS
ncbi:MAG: sodium:solute symporter family protein [candidate division KSB1 bacterium]|nr:sodium:solute symporter family protein [candidate division KSB1 bacterium]